MIFNDTPRYSMESPLAQRATEVVARPKFTRQGRGRGRGVGCRTDSLESNGVHMEYGVERAIMEEP